jgi:hypothetical protein
MKARTEIKLGMISAFALILLPVYYSYSLQIPLRTISLDALFLTGYILALVFKRLGIAKSMFIFFIFVTLSIFQSLPSEILKNPKKYTFVWSFTIIVLCAFVFLLGVGIRGLKRLMEEESKIKVEVMKANTQMMFGLWGAMAFIVLRISEAVRFWVSYSTIHRGGLILSIIIFSIYIFGILSKKLIVTQRIYCAWWVFISISLIDIFIGSVAIGKWSGNLENVFTVLWTFLFLVTRFGILTLILWEGLRGLRQIIEAKDTVN